MIFNILTRIFGSKNERTLSKYRNVLKEVNKLSDALKLLTEDQLCEEILSIKQKINQENALKYQPNIFAIVRELSDRLLKMRHYDVQILGGCALCEGKISEMGTGEGKTLVATLPAAFYAIAKKKVFVVTVNDYLAHRDASWMKPLYESLGLTVGIVTADQSRQEKREAYNSDIIYVTNNELGFDYLRDRMVFENQDKLLPNFDFAIIDEVDSILIDEARTPLVISGPKESDLTLYTVLDKMALNLSQSTKDEDPETGDFSIDSKAKQLYLSERGHERLEQLLHAEGLLPNHHSLYQPTQAALLHHAMAALRAHYLFKKDHDYIVHEGKVIIIDEHSGRASIGRRWSDGLHQAIEAKEKVEIHHENLTLASITFQNFFKLFSKLSGMTGTADTEAFELHEIYGLDVVVIPPNRTSQRKDASDLIYTSEKSKYQAVVEEIKRQHMTGRPVLVGTIAIEKSEYLSSLLSAENIKHVVLNAKQHSKEAEIVAQAGRKYAVTIATNMAGRGTDIILGGTFKSFQADHPDLSLEEAREQWLLSQNEVKSLGGLHILGSERHESRRIDNQLRGRSGRQGDPGSSQFFLSLDDYLLKALIPPQYIEFFKKWNDAPDTPIVSPMLSRLIEKAQRNIEGFHFDMRKQRLEEDNVANDQRNVVYACRDEVLMHDQPIELLARYAFETVDGICTSFLKDAYKNSWDITGLMKYFQGEYNIHLEKDILEKYSIEQLKEYLGEKIINVYKERVQGFDQKLIIRFERSVILHYLDNLWREHLTQLELARQHVALRGYAQKDPKQEYKMEAFRLFEAFMQRFAMSVISSVMRAKFLTPEEIEELEQQEQSGEKALQQRVEPHHEEVDTFQDEKKPRNQRCDCGSQKKYKHCCGKITT